MIKERPILFNAEMVRAILDGRKTQTRRIINPQPEPHIQLITSKSGRHLADDFNNDLIYFDCPYGKSGDKLWVRETFVIETNQYADFLEEYDPPHADGRPVKTFNGDIWQQCHYKATDSTPELMYDDFYGPHCRWKPSIHMPRWASRINLLITDIRVERLQDISEEDAIAEGVDETLLPDIKVPSNSPMAKMLAIYKNNVDIFSSLWESINGAGSWDLNPYIWVIEFELIRR